MVGKLYVYDTYYNHYVHNYDNYNGGANSSTNLYVNDTPTFDNDNFLWASSGYQNGGVAGSTVGDPDPTRTNQTFGSSAQLTANRHVRYHSLLTNSKEIGPGEFVGKSFFDIDNTSTHHHNMWMRGFSNFSLGAAYEESYNTYRSFLVYGKLDTTDDLSYETISTVQMGTRSILSMSSEAYSSVRDIGVIIGSQCYNFYKGQRFWKSAGGKNQAHAHTKLPFYNYANIVAPNAGQYGGLTKSAIEATRWIIAGNYHPINHDNLHHHSTVFGGDTFVNLYSHQITTCPYPEKAYAKFIVFPVKSVVNLSWSSSCISDAVLTFIK